MFFQVLTVEDDACLFFIFIMGGWCGTTTLYVNIEYSVLIYLLSPKCLHSPLYYCLIDGINYRRRNVLKL